MNAESIFYMHEDFTFVLIFNEKVQADEASEFLIKLFGVDEIALIFHYDDAAIDLEIVSIDGSKSATFNRVKSFNGYAEGLERIKETFDDAFFGEPLREKMLLMTAIRTGDFSNLQFTPSLYQGTIGLGNIKYISADRI